MGIRIAVTPRIQRILKIFEPTTFPTAISDSFFIDATIEVNNSGKLVPTATTVNPITASLKLKNLAKPLFNLPIKIGIALSIFGDK